MSEKYLRLRAYVSLFLVGEYGFLLPPEQIIPTGEEIWAFHVSAANQVIQEFY